MEQYNAEAGRSRSKEGFEPGRMRKRGREKKNGNKVISDRVKIDKHDNVTITLGSPR